jgi:hypothetical protein
MSERRDDTPEQDEPSRAERKPGGYYYDDSTGYEIYDPSSDEEDEKDDGQDSEPGQTVDPDTPSA